MHFTKSILVLAVSAVSVLAAPADFDSLLVERASKNVNPNAITGLKCTAKGTAINNHNINVALLGICGGIAGAIQQCQGRPTTTTGISLDAKFTLTAATKGAQIIVSKGRWEGCVRAARAVCGDSPFTATCVGGATSGNVNFTLEKNA